MKRMRQTHDQIFNQGNFKEKASLQATGYGE